MTSAGLESGVASRLSGLKLSLISDLGGLDEPAILGGVARTSERVGVECLLSVHGDLGGGGESVSASHISVIPPDNPKVNCIHQVFLDYFILTENR